ncbi:MAG TPA: ABC transporter ATP-binding protein [Gemmatimonadales bacterium]|jgi:subfamily B ATP-binding cassette protein MsbA|nr:ABC transporter ATP-binding protein [Gemmatimonadales bacterium]
MRARLLALLKPQALTFGAGLVAAFIGSTLDGAAIIFLVPLLKHLFGTTAGMAPGGTRLDDTLGRLLAPVVAGASPAVVTERLVLLFLAALAVKNLANYIAAYLSVVVQENMVRDLRNRLYAHLLELDLGVYQRTRGGQFAAALVSDADQVKQLVVAVLAAFFQNFVMILATLAVLCALSVRLTLMVLVLVPILIAAVGAVVSRLKRHAITFAHERGELTSTITERLGAMKLIRAYGAEATEVGAFAAQSQRYRKGYVRTQRFALLTSPVSELFGGAIIVLILWAASNQDISNVRMNAADTIIFVVAALRLMSPLKAITQVPAQLAIAEASAARVFALLDSPDTEADAPGAHPAVFARDLVMDHVSFGYEAGVPILHDVSLRAAKGDVVAIVGPSGAGKTTLVELVPRFHDPTSGEVRLDGVPLTALSRASLRALIAVVSQDTIILHDSVRANIAYGRPGARDADIEAAAAAANAHEFIADLPDGYATILGERGTRLSGGQRQRIAIARALLRDAPILILDEATSALDTASERLVQEAIDRLMRDRTVLVIAHRLATVRQADRIVVLSEGAVVEAGTHAELLALGGMYRRLYDLQFSVDEVTT